MSRLLPALHAAGWTVAASVQARRSDRPSWQRTNFRGRTVSLSGGIATAVGTLAGAASVGGAPALAGAVAVTAAGGLGALDDLTEREQDRGTKGLRGHLGALAEGTVTTGAIKLLGITAASLLAGTVLADARRRTAGSTGSTASLALTALDSVTSGALVAGTANLLNLLDLRPGRALKAAILLGAPLAAAGGPGAGIGSAVVGAAVAAAPTDLAETTMLGDTGANALGAALGVGLASHPHPAVRLGALAVVVAGTLASERVSFSRVIDATPALAWVDGLGRDGAGR